MIYKDQIYGKVEITEPIIIELIQSKALQRLKDIEQAGYFQPFHPGTWHSRFEHSVGVFLLLQKFGAPLEEQIAGLIHDASHSVFSHCIDYILDVGSEKEHNHQDNIHEDFIKKTEIPKIVKKYKLNLSYLLDEKNFPLKERKLPDLCADRIDYSLRSAAVYKAASKRQLQIYLNDLITINNYWVFKNSQTAKSYAKLFYQLNRNYYSDLSSAVMFRTTGDCVRYALKNGYLNKNDLYQTDKVVTSKIQKHLSKDQNLKLLWQRMNNQVPYENDPKNFQSKVTCKSRIVDPLFIDKDKQIKRLSEMDKNWQKIVKEELKPKYYYLKFSSRY